MGADEQAHSYTHENYYQNHVLSKGNSISPEEALRLKEKSKMGRELYDEFRAIFKKTNVDIPSRYQLDIYRQTVKPKLETYLHGKWMDLYTIMHKTFEEIFEVHDIQPTSGHLSCMSVIGFDLSGSHQQYQFKTIDIDTKKLIYGK